MNKSAISNPCDSGNENTFRAYCEGETKETSTAEIVILEIVHKNCAEFGFSASGLVAQNTKTCDCIRNANNRNFQKLVNQSLSQTDEVISPIFSDIGPTKNTLDYKR